MDEPGYTQVLLAPNCLLKFEADAYSSYLHSIPPATRLDEYGRAIELVGELDEGHELIEVGNMKEEGIDLGDVIQRPQVRISMTFRHKI